MTTQHTPWVLERMAVGIKVSSWEHTIAYLPLVGFGGQDFNPEQQANAQLIAAAPELLAACIAAQRYVAPTPGLEALNDVLRAAIAKAEGAQLGGE